MLLGFLFADFERNDAKAMAAVQGLITDEALA